MSFYLDLHSTYPPSFFAHLRHTIVNRVFEKVLQYLFKEKMHIGDESALQHVTMGVTLYKGTTFVPEGILITRNVTSFPILKMHESLRKRADAYLKEFSEVMDKDYRTFESYVASALVQFQNHGSLKVFPEPLWPLILAEFEWDSTIAIEQATKEDTTSKVHQGFLECYNQRLLQDMLMS